MWLDETIARWKTEGMPTNLKNVFEISRYFNLDPCRPGQDFLECF